MRIDNPNQQQPATPGPHDTSAHAGMNTGYWRGATIQASANPSDLLTDAAEEIGFSHSEHVETRKLEEREISEHPEVVLPKIEAVLRYLESVSHGDPQERLKQFVDTLRRQARHGGRNSPDAKEEAKCQFDSVTEQFMALSFAAQTLSQEGGYQKLVEDIRGALEDMHDEHGAHIRANLNSVRAALEFTEGDKSGVANFQAAYRDAVLGEDSLAGVLKGTLERFDLTDFRAAAQHMIRALGDDLASVHGSSAEAARLNAVLQNLYLVEVLSTVLDGCQAFASRMQSHHGVKNIRPDELLQDLASASGERWTNAGRFASIADKYKTYDASARVTFLAGIKNLVHNMPIKVFNDTDARFNILGAAQDALDAAIAHEEEIE